MRSESSGSWNKDGGSVKDRSGVEYTETQKLTSVHLHPNCTSPSLIPAERSVRMLVLGVEITEGGSRLYDLKNSSDELLFIPN